MAPLAAASRPLCRTLLLVALIAGAFGSPTSSTASQSVSPTPTVATTATPTPSPTARAVEEATVRFSLVLPPKWKRIDVDARTLDSILQGIDDPQLQAVIRGQVQSLVGSGATFVAFDLAPERAVPGFVTNLNIIYQALPAGYGLDFLTSLSIGQLENLDMIATPIEHHRVDLDAGPAERIQYRINAKAASGAALSYIATQYVVVSGLDSFILTFSTTPPSLATYEPMFDQVARSFALKR